MTISYNDLNPIDTKVYINEQEFTLGKFSLLAQCWADQEFATEDEPSGVMALSKVIQDWTKPDPILRLSWYLLKEKSQFNNEYEQYIDFIDNKKIKWINIKNIFQAVVRTIGVSQPQIDEIEEELELKKSLAVES